MIRPWTLQLPALVSFSLEFLNLNQGNIPFCDPVSLYLHILRMLALLVFSYTIMNDLTWRSFVDNQSEYIFGKSSYSLKTLKTEHNYTFEDVRTRTQIQSKLFIVILCLSSIWYVLQEPMWSKIWTVPIINAFLVLLGSIVMMSCVESYKFIYKDLIDETNNRMFSKIFLSCFQLYGMKPFDDVVILNETEWAVRESHCVCQDFIWKNVAALLALLSGILLIFSCLLILINNVEGNFLWRNVQERAPDEMLNLELIQQNNPPDQTELVLIPCLELIEIDSKTHGIGISESETEIKVKKIQQMLTKHDHQNNNEKSSIPIPKALEPSASDSNDKNISNTINV